MATATGSKKLIIFLSIFIAIYCLVSVVSAFFLMAWSWGEKLNIFQKTVLFVLRKPFDPSKSLFFIVVNGLFWGFITYGILFVIKKISK